MLHSSFELTTIKKSRKTLQLVSVQKPISFAIRTNCQSPKYSWCSTNCPPFHNGSFSSHDPLFLSQLFTLIKTPHNGNVSTITGTFSRGAAVLEWFNCSNLSTHLLDASRWISTVVSFFIPIFYDMKCFCKTFKKWSTFCLHKSVEAVIDWLTLIEGLDA